MIDAVLQEKVLCWVYLRTLLDCILGYHFGIAKILSHCDNKAITGICEYDTTQAKMALVCGLLPDVISMFSHIAGYKNDIIIS